jgi:hypothetical protein
MTVIVKHNKTNTITDWTQAQLDAQIALGNFAPGTTLANIVLPSDWNNDHTLTGLGTMAEQDANSIAITGGTINNTTIGATTATTGKFTSVTTPSVTATTNDLTLSAISTGAVLASTANGTAFSITDSGATATAFVQVASGGSGQNGAYVRSNGSATNPNLYLQTKGTGSVNFYSNSLVSAAQQFSVGHTASAVNYVQVTGAATGNTPAITAQGSDGNAGLTIQAKGTAGVNIGNGTYFKALEVTAGGVANYTQIASAASTFATTFKSLGTDTNISMAFQPKGTGAIDLAAGSSGVNISNGGTVTAITRTAAGSAYTSFPTMAISAPTTAGGVQATATFTMGLAGVPTITNGGTGYTVGNTLTFVGGTGTAATLTVSTVSAGVITGVTIASFGLYTALPSNPISVTGGSGSGATFTATWAINSAFTITNAGSGYIEQPTITFSGGGGSGAAAYAVVGSGTTIQTLGSSLTLQTPSLNTNNTFLQVKDDLTNPASQTAFYVVGASSGLGRLALRSSKALYVSSGSSNNISFTTGSSATVDGSIQFTVANTTSAVNYVQVTGGTTGNGAVISAQGSDGNVNLRLASKGTGVFQVTTDTNSFIGFNILNRATSGDSYFQIQRNLGYADLQVTGATDADLKLTPNGVGVVRFGTYTGTILTPTGFIEIKDSGGTTRRLLVG